MPSRPRTDARAAQNAGSGDTAARADPLIGAMLGDYQVLERIGEGGMGVVYRGLHPTIKKRVAIKVLKPSDDPQQARRLVTEAEAVNAIGDRHIIDIFGHGTLEDGRHYIVMEFLEGDSLEEHLLKSGGVPWQEACGLLIEVCRPLQAAHSRGVIHRDLKPSNIFLVKQRDGSHYVKLLDFGLAKLTRSAFKSSQQSNAFEVNGTPAYMAPEQSRGQPVSAATDLYALGVIAFELLAGRLPFSADNPMDLMMAHVGQAPPPLAALAPNTPPLLQRLVHQLLEKEPGRRPASADVVRRQLDQARAQNITQSSLPTEELQATTFDVLAMQAAVRAAPRSDGQRSAPRAPDSGPTQPALAGGREVATLPAAPAAPAVTPSKVGEPRRSAPALTGEARSGLETRGVPGARAAPEARGALGTTPQARSAFEPSGEPATAPRLTPADDVEPRALGTTPQARPAFEPSGEPGTAPRLTPADDVEPRALGTTPQARPAFEPSGEPGTAPRLTPADDVEPRADVTQQVRLRLQPERPPPRPSALRSALWGGLAALVLAALAAAAWLAFKPQPAPPAPTPKPLHPLTAEPANGP